MKKKLFSTSFFLQNFLYTLSATDINTDEFENIPLNNIQKHSRHQLFDYLLENPADHSILSPMGIIQVLGGISCIERQNETFNPGISIHEINHHIIQKIPTYMIVSEYYNREVKEFFFKNISYFFMFENEEEINKKNYPNAFNKIKEKIGMEAVFINVNEFDPMGSINKIIAEESDQQFERIIDDRDLNGINIKSGHFLLLQTFCFQMDWMHSFQSRTIFFNDHQEGKNLLSFGSDRVQLELYIDQNQESQFAKTIFFKIPMVNAGEMFFRYDPKQLKLITMEDIQNFNDYSTLHSVDLNIPVITISEKYYYNSLLGKLSQNFNQPFLNPENNMCEVKNLLFFLQQIRLSICQKGITSSTKIGWNDDTDQKSGMNSINSEMPPLLIHLKHPFSFAVIKNNVILFRGYVDSLITDDQNSVQPYKN